jgi:hypothetical protein
MSTVRRPSLVHGYVAILFLAKDNLENGALI